MRNDASERSCFETCTKLFIEDGFFSENQEGILENCLFNLMVPKINSI
jgi:hypothetical protein